MNKQLLRLSQIVLITSLTSLMSFAQSNFNGPVYELKVNGLESGADFKNLVTLVRNSPNVDYCRVANEEDGLVIQTKEDMTYEELSALISETGFSIKGDVVTSKGVRMRSNVEIAQPEQNEER